MCRAVSSATPALDRAFAEAGLKAYAEANAKGQTP